MKSILADILPQDPKDVQLPPTPPPPSRIPRGCPLDAVVPSSTSQKSSGIPRTTRPPAPKQSHPTQAGLNHRPPAPRRQTALDGHAEAASTQPIQISKAKIFDGKVLERVYNSWGLGEKAPEPKAPRKRREVENDGEGWFSGFIDSLKPFLMAVASAAVGVVVMLLYQAYLRSSRNRKTVSSPVEEKEILDELRESLRLRDDIKQRLRTNNQLPPSGEK